MILESTFSVIINDNLEFLTVKYVQPDTPWYRWIFGNRYQAGGRYVVIRQLTGIKYYSSTVVGAPDPVKMFEKAWQVVADMENNDVTDLKPDGK